jgi:hypothetical protein
LSLNCIFQAQRPSCRECTLPKGSCECRICGELPWCGESCEASGSLLGELPRAPIRGCPRFARLNRETLAVEYPNKKARKARG